MRLGYGLTLGQHRQSWSQYWATHYISELTVLKTSDTAYTISATIVGTGQGGMSVEYSSDLINWTEKGATTGSSLNATGMTSGTLYWWRVRLYKGLNYSDYTRWAMPLPVTDLVQWNGIDTIVTSGSFYSATTTGVAIITKYKPERVTGYRTITQIKVHNKTKANVANVLFFVWRLNGLGTYDRVYYEDVFAKLSANDEVQTVTLASSVAVQEGDFVGMDWISSSGSVQVCGVKAMPAGTTKYIFSLLPANPTDWETAGSNLSNMASIQMFGPAPLCANIGDSIISAGPLHYGMLDTTRPTVDVPKSWSYKLYALDNRFIYQNLGIGGEQTTAIEARFNRDAVLKKPRFAIINGGLNDIDLGASKATFIAKMTAMLDACETNNIIPIVWKITPWTSGTTGELQTRDDWNTDLAALVLTYTGAIFISFDDMAKFRVGGDAGNLWDIKTEYDHDGVHFNEAGNAVVAQKVYNAIKALYQF